MRARLSLTTAMKPRLRMTLKLKKPMMRRMRLRMTKRIIPTI